MKYQLIASNLSGSPSVASLGGRDYLVAEATLIVPGVLNGSRGPLLYTADEIAKDPSAWNDLPILVRHPHQKGMSGRSPEAFNLQGIGRVFNAKVVDGRLRAKLWFDKERTEELSPSIYNSLILGSQIELSTGLGIEEDPVEEGAVFNSPTEGEIPYKGIAVNFKPDHIAILPDQVGACSLKDGCGVNNEMSQDDIRSNLDSQIQERFGPSNKELWISDVFETFLIFRMDGGLFRLGYGTVDGKVKVSEDEPKAVQRKTVYEYISNVGGHVGSSVISFDEGVPNMAKLTVEQRKEIVQGLISNSCCWGEDDRVELENMSDVVLMRTKENSDKQTELETIQNAAESGMGQGTGQLVGNRAKTLTREQFMEMADPETREILNYANEAMTAEKRSLIDRILQNVSADEKPKQVEHFAKKSLEDLRVIAAVMPPKHEASPAENFYGPTHVVEARRLPKVENSRDGVTNKAEDLDMVPPEIDFTADSSLGK